MSYFWSVLKMVQQRSPKYCQLITNTDRQVVLAYSTRTGLIKQRCENFKQRNLEFSLL